MFTYMIVVNDNGELKTVTHTEIKSAADNPRAPDAGQVCSDIDVTLEKVLDFILDERSASEALAHMEATK